jgi:glycosyltransferase involved in cell wall biosynthesis
MTDPLGQSQVLPYLERLSKYGYHFTILSCEKPKNYSLHKNEVEKIIASSGIDWAPIRYHKKPAVLSTIYDVMLLKKKAKELHKKKRFDLLHTRPGIPALIGLEMKKKSGVKFLNDIREFYSDSRIEGNIWNGQKFLYKKIYEFFRQKEKEAVTKNDGIVCLTSTAEKIIRQWPEYKSDVPLQVIPCSVDNHLFNPERIDLKLKESFKKQLNIRDDDFIVSYLGSLGSWYLIEEMMQFFKIISAKNDKAKFLFISPATREAIVKEAYKVGLDENKIVSIKAKRNEVPVLLSFSKFSVFFIRPCYSKQSSSPTKHGEIMAMGIPVISNSGVGDVADIISNSKAGIVIKDFSRMEFEKAASAVCSNSVFDKNEIRKAAIDYYDLNVAVQKYKTIYDEICKSNRDAY